jgi:hypothetical protein
MGRSGFIGSDACAGPLRFAIAMFLLLLSWSAPAATYYYSISGNNANDGSQGSPFRTIQKGADVAVAGDTVRALDNGNYDERVTPPTSGTVAAPVTFIGNSSGTGVVMYGFAIADKSNIRVIGFEIRHVNASYRAALFLSGVCSNIMFLDNYVHDTSQEAIQTANPATPTYVTIRGNTFYYVSHPGQPAGAETAIANCAILPKGWIVEYNHIQRTMDFCNLYGALHILRNNWFHDFSYNYYTNQGHSDMFQPGSDGQVTGCSNHVYEANMTGDSDTTDSHFGLWQNTIGAGDNNMLVRGNVGCNIGDGGVGVRGTDDMMTHNNTFHDMCRAIDGASFLWTGPSSTNGICKNNLLSKTGLSTYGVRIEAGHTVDTNNNWGFDITASALNTSPSIIGTNDPLFMNTNYAALDLRLQSGSPVRGRGTNIVKITSASGSGTSFAVDRPKALIDGFGLVEGDLVTIGSTVTRILSNNWATSTITVANSVSWTQNDPIYWGALGSQKDIGAYPYGATFLSGATYLVSGSTYSVTPVGDARGIRVYVDYIPKHYIYEKTNGVYSVTESGNVTGIKAYALYAQTNMVVVAVPGTGGPAVQCTCIAASRAKSGGRSF